LSSSSTEDISANIKAALDYINSCPVNKDGDKITINMQPTYEDIKKIIPKKTLDEINSGLGGQFTFEQLMNALTIQAVVTVDKNSTLFIPKPHISNISLFLKGNSSKLISNMEGLTDEEKAILESFSFTASGSLDMGKEGNITIEKPQGIQ
jgi:hypothetical protein